MKKILIALSVTGILLLNSLSVFACPTGSCTPGSSNKCCSNYTYKCECTGGLCDWIATVTSC